MKLARGSSGASPLSRLAPVGNGATAEAAEMFMPAPLRALEGSRYHHAAIAHRGGRMPRKLLVVMLAIGSLIARHAIAAALAHIPLCLRRFDQRSVVYELMCKEVWRGYI